MSEGPKIRCSCGCNHMTSEITGKIWRVTKSHCTCPDWIIHAILSADRDGLSGCTAQLYPGDPCLSQATYGVLCEGHYTALTLGFDPARATEYASNQEPATTKQIEYIGTLAKEYPEYYNKLISAIWAFYTPDMYEHGLCKGEASWVIQMMQERHSRKPN